MNEQRYSKETYDTDIASALKERIFDEGENTFPRDVVLETTTFCNLNCIMCTNDKLTRAKTTMRWPLYVKLVEEIAEKAKDTTRLWLCFFGEPLMDKQFVDRVLFAKQKGIKNVVINSNMNLMTEKLAEELVKAGLNNIFVGLDAASADTYDKIRLGGNFDKTVNNVIYYKKMLDKYGKDDQQIVVQFVELPENAHEIEQAVEFWNNQDIKVKIKPIVTWQNNVEYENKLQANDRIPCYYIMNVLPVTADGFAGFCGCDYDGRVICANMNESTIEELWNTSKKEQRRIHLAGEWDKLLGFCRACEDWRGGYAKYK